MSKEKATHQDETDFEGPIDTGNPHAKRPLDKKQGDAEADTSVSAKDPGKVFDSGKVAEDISSLFAGVEGLSEGFAEKATVILEGALSEQVENIREQFEAKYVAQLDEAVAAISADLEDKLDSYLGFVAEQFMKENQLAIDNGIKNDIAEQVLESVTAIIESAGVTLPDDKIDVAESLIGELKDAETKLNEQMTANIELTKQVRSFELKEAFAELSEGLSVASKERLAKLAENISFDDVADYKSKVATLKESVSGAPAKPEAKVDALNESVELTNGGGKKPNPVMEAYLRAAVGSGYAK